MASNWKQEAFEKWWSNRPDVLRDAQPYPWLKVYHAALSNIPWLPVSVEPEESGWYVVQLTDESLNTDEYEADGGWWGNDITHYKPIRLDPFPEEDSDG